MTKKTTEYRSTAPDHAVHDVGGLDFGNVDFHEHDLAFWERRVDAMIVLLATKKNAFKIDAHAPRHRKLRRAAVHDTTYYEKWCRALRNLVVEQGIISRDELAAKIVETRRQMQAAGRDASDEDVPWNEGVWNEEALKS